MKLIFVDTGDYIDFVPENNRFVDLWFENIFDRKINEYEIFFSSAADIQNWISQLNIALNESNTYANSRIRNFEFNFRNLEDLDQEILNYNHKQWVAATEKYLNELHSRPECWSNVNHLIHRIERNYSALFWNKHSDKPFDVEYTKYLKPEHCSYESKDLVIHYTNLGRHQYQQWLTGSKLDDETNNYKTVSMNFEYQYNLDCIPSSINSPAPVEYVKWCHDNNIEILPPWIQIGKFLKYDRHEVKKIMHRNFICNKSVRFEYE